MCTRPIRNVLSLLVLLPLSPWFCPAGLAARITRTAEIFNSGDKPIRIGVFEPKKPGKYPAIFFLHADDGLQARKSLYQRYAKKAAGQGYAVFLVYYFDRTGTNVADKTTLNQQNFITWMRTVADAVTFAAKRPKVDASRVGLLGISLGATLSLSIATQDPRIGSVVEFFGEMPDLAAQFMKRMAPTLILHGDADDVVPVEKAYKLERLLQAKKIPYEMKIYPGEGHSFKTKDLRDAAGRSLAFFDKNLKLAPPQPKPAEAEAAQPGSETSAGWLAPYCPADCLRQHVTALTLFLHRLRTWLILTEVD